MGTGKTTVGRLLAAQLAWAFVDTDALIVKRDGRAITDIFAQEGEPYFRQLERAVSLELATQNNLVIATGGRLLLDPVNAAAFTRHGRVFCLTATVEEILRRVQDDDARPLLHGPNPAARIRQLLAAREEGYGRFPQIATDGKTPLQIAEEILTCVSIM